MVLNILIYIWMFIQCLFKVSFIELKKKRIFIYIFVQLIHDINPYVCSYNKLYLGV